MAMISSVKELIEYHEGRRTEAYRDTKGLWTIGIGRLLGKRSYRGLVISETMVDEWFEEDLKIATYDAHALIPNLNDLSAVRQAVCVDMSFQLGIDKFRGFPMTRGLIRQSLFFQAGDEMLDSKWAKVDTPERAKRLSAMMKSGQWHDRVAS